MKSLILFVLFLPTFIHAGEVELYEVSKKKIRISNNHIHPSVVFTEGSEQMVTVQFYSPIKLLSKYTIEGDLKSVYEMALADDKLHQGNAPFYQDTRPYLLHCLASNKWYVIFYEYRPAIRFMMCEASLFVESEKSSFYHSSSIDATSFHEETLEVLKSLGVTK
jgi:hypothetical protein